MLARVGVMIAGLVMSAGWAAAAVQTPSKQEPAAGSAQAANAGGSGRSDGFAAGVRMRASARDVHPDALSNVNAGPRRSR